MKVALFGTDFFANCFELLEAYGHQVCAVFSQPCDGLFSFNDRVRRIAERWALVLRLDAATAHDIAALANSGCDLVVSGFYAHRIPIEHAPELLAVNIHPTLLPWGRGPWPLPHVILS